MIVESMSLKEVNDQMVKDMPLLQEWTEWKIGYELRSKFAHSKVYPCYAFRTWRSPMTNTLWHILFYCKEKKKANTPVALFYVKYDSDNGKGAYSYEIIGGNFKTVKYLAHFFARFRQRYIEPNHIDISKFKCDIIDYYFLHNKDLYLFSSNKNEYCYGSNEQGSVFGIHENERFYVFKTYINRETLSPKKKQQLDRLLYDLRNTRQITKNINDWKQREYTWQFKWELVEGKGK